MARLPYLSSRLQGYQSTIFAEMSALAVRTGAINLGQGFPDTDGPTEVLEAAVAAIRSGTANQYPPGIGIAELRHAVARHQKRFWGMDVDPDSEVLITAGASEALAASILALTEVGDDVLTFEPWYDLYGAVISMAGAVRKVVTLRPPDYGFDPDELAAAVTPRTRMLVLNSPHNPTGKVFSRAELEAIAEVAVERELLVVTDEVYEHLVFEGEHIPIATLPGMADRTVTISSGGKTFAVTGWKIGWVCARPELVAAVRTAKQWLTYVSGGPFQHAIAAGLDLGDDYFTAQAEDLRAKRDRLSEGLRSTGLEVFEPPGTYFITADIRSIGHDDGIEFCWGLPERIGVAAVPNVVMYDNVHEGRHLVRFAFCKQHDVLDAAIERLRSL
ncbi:pyridoxal phosphate-dependent aminotransferase [Candidatus Poriferisodalis multihospitum]|uniref:pyridoxal phosphate-dependent aminotransferase n=1 Tax=Candidatus Poriferisodalis multihospitum TaxID=2983191 RepID=UPI00238CD9B1|nr:pyridoxal phosphate-dependent aminotransferase [Candidatus Poriferisodalis multihospitum]MDE0319818.1 pyridoxal phosphate-dependent aminotransferase [Acidimicrobiaceae bacterium]